MDDNKTMFSAIFFSILLVVVLIIISYAISNKSCLTSYSQYEPQYGFFEGCRIMVDGKLKPTVS